MINPPQTLVDALKQSRAIAIVGSGLSIPAGAPSWKELLLGLLVSADTGQCFPSQRRKLVTAYQAINQEKYIRAATLIKTVMGGREFRNAVLWWMSHNRKFEFDQAVTGGSGCDEKDPFSRFVGQESPRTLSPTPAHRILMQLGFRAIVTTNYDWLLETALGLSDIVSFSYSYPALSEAVQRTQRFILHAHGDLKNQRDIVLAEDDFQRLYGDENYFKPLMALFSSSFPLWLGYGHNDPDFQQITAKSQHLSLHGGYQLVREDDDLLQVAVDAQGVTPLPLRSYDEIPAFLGELARQAEKRLTISLRVELPVSDHIEMQRREAMLRQAIASMGYQADEVTEGLGASGQLIFDTLNALGRNITDSFLLAALPKAPNMLLAPRLIARADGAQVGKKMEEMFEIWAGKREEGAGKNTAGQKVAIIASPGAGKTVLLAHFARWLHSQSDPNRRGSDLVPIVLFLTPASVADANVVTDTFSGQTLWNQICQRASSAIAGYFSVDRANVLEPFRKAGLVYMLFDGLDEFGARRRGHLDKLTSAFQQLAEEKQIHVLLTCRKVFWEQQVRAKEPWQQVEIVQFTPAELIAAARSPLGRFAYDEQGRPRPGVFNPLIASFVLALAEIPGQECRTRSDLYERWARSIANSAQRDRPDVTAEQWLQIFMTLAYEMLREEKLSMIPPALGSGSQKIQFHEYLATEILVGAGDGVGLRFFHESVQEYLVATFLVPGFKQVLSINDTEDLSQIPLANVDLDFHQTSVYGFLHEKLGPGYLSALVRRLNTAKLSAWPARLLRNLVEYIGMTYRGQEELVGLASWLLHLFCNDQRNEIRYNAARALERIHPWASRPYFDYMSDWGDRDWTSERRRASAARVMPWAVRGQRTKDRTRRRWPGDKPPLAVNNELEIDLALQEKISGTLIRTLSSLLDDWSTQAPLRAANVDSDQNEADWLLINGSFALVRWFHSSHLERLQKLRAKAAAVEASRFVKANLSLWINHALFACPRLEFPLRSAALDFPVDRLGTVFALEFPPLAVVPVASIQESWNLSRGIVRGAKDERSRLVEDHICEELDVDGRLTLSEQPIFGGSAMRRQVWTSAEHFENFRRAFPKQKIRAWIGNGNLLSNPHFVAFARRSDGQGCLYHLASEAAFLGAGRTSRRYTCLVARRDAPTGLRSKVRIETLCFATIEGVAAVFTEHGQEITSEIEFATFGQQIVRNGSAIDDAALASMAASGQFYDLRHLFLFGRVSRGDGRWLDVGLSRFWRSNGRMDTTAVKQALLGRPVEVDVAEFLAKDVEAALQLKGYSPSRSLDAKGTFRLRNKKLQIVFRDGIYPHSMIGVREDGTLLVVGVDGRSNKVGVSVTGAAATMQHLGAKDAIIVDNGRDVTLGHREETVVANLQEGELRLRAMMLFVSAGNPETEASPGALFEFPVR